MGERILIVDDEQAIVDVLALYMENDGYTVDKCCTAAQARACLEQSEPDLAVLDVMLPDGDGFQLCREIRQRAFYPVILLTAKVGDEDKIRGLTLGADDYITKPFNPLEVVARVKTQLRRYHCYNSLPPKQGARWRLFWPRGAATSPWNSARAAGSGRARHGNMTQEVTEQWRRDSTAAVWAAWGAAT